MAISLAKGNRISLEKAAPGINKILLGLGWDTRLTDGAAFDLDSSVLMLDDSGKAIGEGGFVFYGNKTSACGSIQHSGDNLTGEGDGDDESVTIDLSKVPANVQKIIFPVTIHDAEARNQNFGLVENAYIRMVNEDSGEEVLRYDLTEDYSIETALIFAELYRKDGGWSFAAKGDGFEGGLQAIVEAYGLQVA
ncbi:TerD family protein [Vibrio owensii]|uniref:TerD family protein n=1 Tax=Vibrio harveyi group TaxID=717610 RepID=UPI003CC6291C